MAVSHAVLAVLLAISFYKDVRESKIPNAWTVPAAIAGLVLSAGGGWSGLLTSLAGILTGFVFMLILYAIGAVGAGDVKLFAAIGSLAGPEFVLYGIMNSVICAGIVGLVILTARRELFSRLHGAAASVFGFVVLKNIRAFGRLKSADSIRFPFMIAVLPGIFVTWWTM